MADYFPTRFLCLVADSFMTQLTNLRLRYILGALLVNKIDFYNSIMVRNQFCSCPIKCQSFLKSTREANNGGIKMVIDKIRKRIEYENNNNSEAQEEHRSDIPVGKWVKCSKCKEILYKKCKYFLYDKILL